MVSGKRLFDIFISGSGIFVSIPIFLIVSILIWLEDRGPILFKQKRLGRNGKVFTVYKFRKFANRSNDNGPNVTVHNDNRYSKVGRILEKSKLNELPQLINVFKGEMSCVGPRPEIVEYKKCYVGQYEELLKFKPGIFGPSQTLYRNEAQTYIDGYDPEKFYANVLFPMKANIDIKYYRSATVMSDLFWIYRSLSAVVSNDNVAPEINLDTRSEEALR